MDGCGDTYKQAFLKTTFEYGFLQLCLLLQMKSVHIESDAIYSKLVPPRLLVTRHLNLFLSVISFFPIMISTIMIIMIISTTHLLAKFHLNLEVLHLKFTKPASQKMKTQIKLLKKWFQNPDQQKRCQLSKFTKLSLKFTQKVTVNHMLPFPSALCTFVTLVYNKQTNKQTNIM